MAGNTILSLCFPCPTLTQAGPVDEVMTSAFQQLCAHVGQSHHCQVILNVALSNPQAKKRLSTETHQSVYNITITGIYQNVMSARGALLRNNPLKPKLSIKINKACVAMDTFPEPVPGSIAEEQTPSTLSDNLNLPLGSKSSKAGSTDLVVTNTLTKQPDSHTQTCSSNLSDGLSTDSVSVSVTSSSAPAATAATIPASSVKTSFSPYFRILPKFREQVDRISTFTKTSITLISSQFHTPSTKPVVAAHAREEMVELLVTGSWENALAARLLLLVTIDTLQQGIAHERLEVELRFQNMIGGRKRGFIQELMAKTRTNIYLSSPFAQTTDKNGAPVETRYSEIHITGEPAKVQFAKDALLKAYTRVQATSPNSTRQVNVASRKLDWMLLNHRDKLRSIMIDNACYIAFPPLGASHPVICVYGDSKVNVERTIRTVMQLSSQFHSGSINMLSPGRENLLAISPNQPNALSPVAKVSMLASQASQVSGAEVEFRNNGFFIFGNEIQTRSAVQHLVEVDFIKATHFEIKFSVELANEHREFISGKKNGKINRIMKATGAKIKFDPCNEYNFYVDLSSTIPLKAMEALALLQEELPAEISFYVPETYHKRIIGVGGKNIQRIMKKYGVYVKFSNSEEFASLGGYFDNLDNVVARTPSKNAVNLENLKHAVMELVHPKDKDFVNHSVIIPRHYHLSLMADHAKALSEVQETTNAVVRFPERETGSDVVWISGPESFIQQATSMLLSLVDEQYVYSVPFSEAVARVLVKPEFKTEVVEKMKVAWNMTLILPAVKEVPSAGHSDNSASGGTSLGSKSSSSASKRQTTTTHPSPRNPEHGGCIDTEDDEKFIRSLSLTDSDDDDDGEEEDYLFVFKYSRNNESYLQNAKELLVQYLINNQIEVYDDEIRVRRPRSDSFEEAFPHFNSKILSSVTGGELPSPAPAFPNYTLFESSGNAFETLSKASLPGNSGQSSGVTGSGSMVSSDIRALFSQSSAPGLPPLASSPPRWSDQHLRHAVSLSGSSSGITTTSASNPSLSSGQTSGLYHPDNQSPSYNRPTFMPIDPWATSGNQHSLQQQPIASGHPGTIGQARTPPSGLNIPSGSGFYTTNNHSQQSLLFSPEGPYGSTMGYSTGPSSSNYVYSNNNSPVQDLSSNIAHFSSTVGPQHQQDYHPLPQRPLSGSFISRENLQFLEDKGMSGPAFGPGYGPSLNSGNTRSSHQQAMHHQASQPYSLQSAFGQPIQYPRQRQRHSSHNSNASHHTMFLGPVDGSLGSAGGSVNSDISTEDDSDDPLDDMGFRHRSYQYQYQGGQGGLGSQVPSQSILANRRGSVPSMGSMHSDQQLYSDIPHPSAPTSNGVRLSNSSSDLHSRKSLANAMSRLSMGGPSDPGFGSSWSLGGLRGGPSSVIGTSAGPVFNERDLVSSGLGGIIDGGTISHGTLGTLAHTDVSQVYGINSQAPSHSSFGYKDHIGTTLAPSTLPFLSQSALDRSGQHIGSWDR